MEKTWNDYYEKTREGDPNTSLVEAIPYVLSKDIALDLGAGALRDSKYLIDQGFKRVIAVDKNQNFKTTLEDTYSEIELIVSDFNSFEYTKDTYDLVNAQFSLPFSSRETQESVISKIHGSLKESGVFVGTLFGPNDEWANQGDTGFFSLKEAKDLFKDFKVINLKEVEKDAPTAVGQHKHWHIIYFILQK